MTDDSNLVIRWEIGNARARFATGIVESGVFDKGGFKWTIAARERQVDGKTEFTVRCDAGDCGQWKCDAEITLHQLTSSGTLGTVSPIREKHICFNTSNCSVTPLTNWVWNCITGSNWMINGTTVAFELHVKIISSEKDELIANPAEFAAPNRMSNVILKIGEEKLHVSKEFLAVHSPVFETMFFGEFAEKGKDEVEIKDVVYEEFLDLLHFIYLGMLKITDHTVFHLLKLFDRFQMERALEHAKLHLTESKNIDAMTKLLIADQYNLTDLKDHCLQSFTNASELHKKLQDFSECPNFSANMKAAIFDRIVKLKLQ